MVCVSGCKSSFIPTAISMTTFPSFCVFSSLRPLYITLAGEVVSNGEGRVRGVKAEDLGHKDGICLNLSGWGLPSNRPGSILYHLGSKLLW